MNKNILLFLTLSSLASSMQAYDISGKYDKYIDKLQKERDRFSDKRDFKAEARRWNHDFDKLTKRREFVDEIRERESSIRKEIARAF